MDNIWVKRGLVVLAGVVVLLLTQYGKTGHIDPQALALHIANELSTLLVGVAGGWLLTEKPGFMRPSEDREPES